MSGQAPDVLDKYEASETPGSDRLDRIRRLAEEARDLEHQMIELEERRSALSERYFQVTRSLLPEEMTAARLSVMQLEPSGNYPARVVRLELTAQASIPRGWPEERRREAVAELDRCEAGDLVRTSVTVDFPREKREDARSLFSSLQEGGHRPHADESVHHSTLTAWLKARLRNGDPLPDLEKIGGWAGTIARVEEPKR
jgi:hypothetical protein